MKTSVKTAWILWPKDFRENHLYFKNFGLYPLIFMDFKNKFKTSSGFWLSISNFPGFDGWFIKTRYKLTDFLGQTLVRFFNFRLIGIFDFKTKHIFRAV